MAKMGPRQQQIYDVLKSRPGEELLAADIAKELKVAPQVVRVTLRDMVKKKIVKRRVTYGMVDCDRFTDQGIHNQKLVVFSLVDEK